MVGVLDSWTGWLQEGKFGERKGRMGPLYVAFAAFGNGLLLCPIQPCPCDRVQLPVKENIIFDFHLPKIYWYVLDSCKVKSATTKI